MGEDGAVLLHPRIDPGDKPDAVVRPGVGGGVEPQADSTGGPVLLLEMVSSGSIAPLLGISNKVTHTESWEPSTSQVSGTF